MPDKSKNEYVEDLHARTCVSKTFLEKFSAGDLQQFFKKSASPQLVRGTGALSVCFFGCAMIGATLGTIPLAVSGTAALAGFAAVLWHNRLQARNQSVTSLMTERVSAIKPGVV